MAKGTQSARTIKKNNLLSGGRSGESATAKQQLKSMDCPRRKDALRAPNAPSLRSEPLSRNLTLASRTEHRTFYDDPVSVRQWAAETDPNASVDFTEHGLQDASYGADAANLCYPPQYPGSTVKPSRPFQRAPLPSMDLWTQEDSQNQAHNSPAFVDLTHTRRSSDVETTTTAREHPLYQVGPKEDGLYHCPFSGSEDCSHKPEKLKCNYE
ncbi:MAG: hypothetical protein LQ346_004465 [Caloplaca aetnensis]|nr:MAG: hypothetical protein LQ346_004465 [Caloplaca aetnensis]